MLVFVCVCVCVSINAAIDRQVADGRRFATTVGCVQLVSGRTAAV